MKLLFKLALTAGITMLYSCGTPPGESHPSDPPPSSKLIDTARRAPDNNSNNSQPDTFPTESEKRDTLKH